ncbi:MAG TPA: hypothetical protein VJ576_06160 [Rhodocyclaceae bacterium]|nr:hypothetical protein [Rhodocyclaceae bacterium]
MMKKYGTFFFFLISALASPLANADLAKAGNEVKESAVEAAKKTAQVGREVGHATAETAKSVGHAVADGARKAYQATREAVSDTDSSRPNKPPE